MLTHDEKTGRNASSTGGVESNASDRCSSKAAGSTKIQRLSDRPTRALSKTSRMRVAAWAPSRRSTADRGGTAMYDRPIQHASAHLIASTNARLTNIRVSEPEAHSDIVLGINRLKQQERE